MVNDERKVKIMKIQAFGVREDEKQAFEQISAQCGVEVTLSDETPSLENADLVKGYEGVTVLGMDTVEGEEGIVHEDRRTDIISNRNWFYLHQFRNVIMTQHMAFYTKEAVESMVRCGVEGIVQMEKTGSCSTMLTK